MKVVINRYVLRALLLLALAGLFFGGNAVFSALERESGRPKTIAFELPLPPDIKEKYMVDESDLEVDHVIITGFFSEWDPENTNFTMARTGTNRWEISLAFRPGDNQYKFVIYSKDNLYPPIWCQDKKAAKQVDDSFGGFNSVIHVPAIDAPRMVFNLIVLGLGAVLVLYSLLEPLVGFLLRMRMTFHYKLVICILLTGVLSNFAFIVYNNYEEKELIKEGVFDSVNMVHLDMLSEGANFSFAGQAGETNRRKMTDVLEKFMRNARARSVKNMPSNIQVTLSSLEVLDTNLSVMAVGDRGEDLPIRLQTVSNRGLTNMADYFERQVLAALIRGVKKRCPLPLTPVFGTEEFLARSASQNYIDMGNLLGFQCALVPVFEHNLLVGYYGMDLQTEFYGSEIRRVFVFNLYLVLAAALLAALLLSNIGRLVSRNLTELADWTKDIIRGDFEKEKRIETRDELQSLAENFNVMRQSLGGNMKNLRLMSRITSALQAVGSVDDLYFVFLTSLTADFGFGYNRAAVFLVNGENLEGAYAVGCLDEAEVNERFGSMEGYSRARLNAEDFFGDYQPFKERSACRFSEKVMGVSIPEPGAGPGGSVFWDAVKSGKPFLAENGALPEADKKAAELLNLEGFLALPLLRGRDTIGVLAVDSRFQRRRITEEDIKVLQIMINDFAVALENRTIMENLEKTVEQRTRELNSAFSMIKMDLNMAKHIQENILPRDYGAIRGMGFSVQYQPAGDIGGDLYDITEISPGHVRVFIADATGHGVQAAMVTMIIKSEYDKLKQVIKSPNELIETLNDSFLRSYRQLTVFFSCVVADIHTGEGRVVYSNAGHPVQYLRTPGGEIVQLTACGRMVGVVGASLYELKSIQAVSGSRLFLFTDGVTEQFNSDGEEYGEQRLIGRIRAGLPGVREYGDEIIRDLKGFIRDNPINDDITLICCEW